MPKVMLRHAATGRLVFYVAKKDLEDEVTSFEFDRPDKWGGEIVLRDGSNIDRIRWTLRQASR